MEYLPRLRSLTTALLILIALLGSRASAQEYPHVLCPRVAFSKPLPRDLTPMEKRLVCGDTQSDEVGSSWNEIPFNQAQFHLKTFLQSRGYHNPRFQVKDARLLVDLGEPTKIKSVLLMDVPDIIDVTRRRKIVGENLTPDKLDELEAWVRQQLQIHSYPCPELQTEALSTTGEVRIRVKRGLRLKFGEVVEESSDLTPGLLRRYDAFQEGWYFDPRLLELTDRRATQEGVVQNVHFRVTCTVSGAQLHQRIISGPPRLFRFGFGVDSEEYVILRGGWQHNRLGKMGSSIDLTVRTSYTEQEFRADMRWYILNRPSRFHLRPLFNLRHENKIPYDLMTIEGQLLPTTSWEYPHSHLTFGLGPSLEQTQIFRGAGPPYTSLLALESNVEWESHLHEYYRVNPRDGFRVLLNTAHTARNFLAPVSAHQIRLSFQILDNIGNFEPPLGIFGLRGGFLTTLGSGRQELLGLLPSTYRYHLGGSQTLRGFGRDELPRGDYGALTAAFLGIEFRSTGVLPNNFEPYIFVDNGWLGDNSMTLDSTTYYSPGIGLRWGSPIGVFRVSAAHGFLAGAPEPRPQNLSHWQFYLAYGEEF